MTITPLQYRGPTIHKCNAWNVLARRGAFGIEGHHVVSVEITNRGTRLKIFASTRKAKIEARGLR